MGKKAAIWYDRSEYPLPLHRKVSIAVVGWLDNGKPGVLYRISYGDEFYRKGDELWNLHFGGRNVRISKKSEDLCLAAVSRIIAWSDTVPAYGLKLTGGIKYAFNELASEMTDMLENIRERGRILGPMMATEKGVKKLSAEVSQQVKNRSDRGEI